MTFHVLFVCISNRVRSVYAEFLFEKILAERNDGLSHEVKVSSAGFLPQKLKDQLAKVPLPFPYPFYNRAMAATTKATLLKKGIVVSADWRSKELHPEIVKDTNIHNDYGAPRTKGGTDKPLFERSSQNLYDKRDISMGRISYL